MPVRLLQETAAPGELKKDKKIKFVRHSRGRSV